MAAIENGDETCHENVEWLIGEPLDSLQKKIKSKNGLEKSVPALHIGFMEVREYMHFKPIPVSSPNTGQKDFTAEEEEWLETMSFLEDDLHWLLRLPHHRFWSQVVYDESLHKCLESYLTIAPRDYDFINMQLKKEIHDKLMKVHKLTFLIYLRMSTYKESKEHHIRAKVFGDIIYDTFVFDVPKIMDLCVLYGFQNKAVLTKMVKNIFQQQPKYLDDLTETSAVTLNAFSFAEEKLFLNVPEKHGGCRKLEDNTSTGIKVMSLSLFCDVIGYITDTCATIYMFLEIYSNACQIFYQNGAITRLVGFYEQTFPAVEKEIMRLKKSSANKSVLEALEKKLTLAKTFLINIFRNILSFCCIQYILDSSSQRKSLSKVTPDEEFLDIFMEVAAEKRFLHDYNVIYPFESDLELLIQAEYHLDPQRLNYIFSSIHDSSEPLVSNTFTSTSVKGARPKTQRPCEGFTKDLHSAASILKSEAKSILLNGTVSSEYVGDRPPSEEQIYSLIQKVQDLLPDLGEGFIEESLKYYGYDSEKCIDALLQNELPSCLDKLDKKLPRVLQPASSQSSARSSILADRKCVFDNDEFDLFNRDDVNLKNIHIGKKNKTPNAYHSIDTEEDSEFLKNLICTFAEQESDDEDINDAMYEDEYDDTYDSALVGLKEPLLENEPDVEEHQPEENSKNIANDMREHRPDDFCENPEIQRQRNEERKQAKAATRNRGGRGSGGPPPSSSQDNRAHKDKNKAYVANHNRRKQADFKKSRGMMSFPTR